MQTPLAPSGQIAAGLPALLQPRLLDEVRPSAAPQQGPELPTITSGLVTHVHSAQMWLLLIAL